jgi:2-polyprenyl-6-methoxyphenol hydroxylase-like FAD-dependent oxidoreductase
MRSNGPLPIAIIGAGPIGLATAAQLLERGLEPLVFEAGAHVGTAIRSWGHVRVFSPWELNVDPAAVRLLSAAGWDAPPADGYPTATSSCFATWSHSPRCRRSPGCCACGLE